MLGRDSCDGLELSAGIWLRNSLGRAWLLTGSKWRKGGLLADHLWVLIPPLWDELAGFFEAILSYQAYIGIQVNLETGV